MISVQPETVPTKLSSAPSPQDVGSLYTGIAGRFFKYLILSLLFFLFLLPDVAGQAWLDGYCYRKQITINSSQVAGGSNHTDFPVMINIASDTDLEDEASGGLVNSANGWDLVFTASDGTTLLDHDMEHYEPTTGEYVAWVKIPILDYNDNTIIYLYYGYDTPAADPSTSTTWSNGFVSVYHLHDDANDALGPNNGTIIGSVDVAGIAADAEDFESDNNTDRIELGNFDVTASAITISAWIRPETFTVTDARVVSKATGSNDQQHTWMLSTIGDGTQLRFRLKTGGTTTTYMPGNSVLSTGSWHYVSAVYGGTNMRLYHNGSQLGTGQAKGGNIDSEPAVDVAIGNQPLSAHGSGGTKEFDGRIDEARIANTNRSSAWLTTEYNNLNAPGAFYSIGSSTANPNLVAAAGSDDNVCGSYSYALNATPSVGSGMWTHTGGPGSVTSWGAGQTLASTTVTVDTYGQLTFTWTETFGTCEDSDDVIIDFFEKPIGQVSLATQTVCSDEAITNILLSTSNGMDGSTTYAWSRDNTVNVTGILASGTGNITGTLTNNTTSPQLVTFTITPTSGGCDGDAFIATVTVNPTGQVNDPADQVVCNQESTAPINYTTVNTGGTTTYTWFIGPPFNLPGSGNIASFTAVNTGSSPLILTVTVTPHFTNAGETCDGPSEDFTITVNPTAQVDDPANQVVCNTDNTAPVTFTTNRSVGVSTYTWTNNNTSIGLGASGNGDIPAFAAINIGTTPVMATIIVTPHFTYDGLTCDGPTQSFTIIVNPTAQVDDPADQVVCNTDATSVTFTTTTSGGTATYTWVNDTPGIGLAGSGSGDISFSAVNLGTSPVVATLIVTPHFTNGSVTCDGPTQEFTITVNPTAQVNDPADQVVCNTDATAVNYTTTTSGGTATYTWVNDTPGIGLAASGNGDISFNAINLGTSPVVATITVTPHFTNGSVTCDGPPEDFTITVNPTAQVNDPADQVVCNTDNTTAVIFTTTTSGGTATYDWVNDTPGIGLAATGSGDIASFVAVNAGTSPVVATITVTPSFENGTVTCTGPTQQFTITVNPAAQVNDPADQVVCNTDATSVSFTTTTSGGTTTYTWVNDTPGIGLAASGSGNISFNAVNAVTSPVVATITVSPHFTNGSVTCDGPTQQFTITVNPTAQVNDVESQVVCNTDATIVNFTTPNSGGTVTYTWVNDTPGIGLAASGSGNISFNAVNAGTSPLVADIIVTPHFTNGGVTCDGPTDDFTITVNPTAQVNDPADQVVCNTDVTVVNFTTITSGGVATYTWVNDTPGIGLAASGIGNISFNAINLGTSPVVATITVTPHFTNGSVICDGPTQQFTITVNPTAQVNDPADQVVCNTDNTAAVTFGTDRTGGTTTYDWTNDTPGIGLAANGSGDIASFVAVNAGSSPVTATITVTPSFENGTVICTGPTQQFTITVNPTAQVNDPADQVVCNTDNTTAVIFGTDRTGGTTTFDWINDTPGIGLAATGSGDIASFVAVNAGSAPVTATITVTPSFENGTVSCTGPTQQFTITVNPTAQINDPADQVVCNTENTALVSFTTDRTGGTTTYTWTNDIPSIGLAATGSGDIPSFAAINTGLTPVIATITVTPHFTNGSVTCDGPTQEFTITVNPTAQVNDPADQVVCNTDVTVVTFTTTTSGGTVTYTWVNDTPGIGLAAIGSGDISFTAVNIGTAPVVATIIVTPHFEYDSHSCDGPTQEFTITVNPTAQVDDPADQVVCNTENTGPVTFTTDRTLGISTYTWTNDTPAIGLAATGSGNIPSFAAINTGTAPVIATITVTPHFTYDGHTCDGPPETFTITVNPTAQVDDPADQVVCNTENTALVTFTTDRTVGVTTYTWTNDTPVIGLAASGTGDIPSFAAINLGLGPLIAIITVTPHFVYDGHNCDGPQQSFTITVNPTALVADPADQVVCNTEYTADVTFTTDRLGGATTYTWTNDTPSIGLAASGTGDIPSFETINTGTAPVIATITVTPHFTYDGLTCDGPPQTFTITVNPTAQVDDPADQVVCNTENTAIVTFTTDRTGGFDSYTWTNDNPAIGLAASGNGDIPSFAAINIGSAPIVATITVTPFFFNDGHNCNGPPETFTITVNPTAQVNDPADQVVCNTDLTAVAFTTTTSGGAPTYTWVNDTPGIGLAASGAGDISFNAVNVGTAPVVATIVVTPHFEYDGHTCDGPIQTFTITVNPTAQVDDPADQVVCNTENTALITFTTDRTLGASTYTWTNDTPSIGLAASGSGNIPSFAAINTGLIPVIATITVTPHFTYGGHNCDGPPETFTITVNPTAQVNEPADQVVCNTDLTTVTFTTTTSGGTVTYTWVNDTPGIGLAASGGGDISFNAVNIGTAPVVATIIVTPHFEYDGHMCDGPTQEFTITVNPTAQVDDPADQVVCNTENTGPVTFTTDRTLGVTTYTWTNDTPSIGLAASGSGNIPSFAAINTGTAPVIATITVTPHFTYGGHTCDGPPETFTITVNPTAQVDDPADQVVCNTENTALVTYTTDRTVDITTYTWVNDTPAIGLAATGIGDIPSFVAINAGLSPVIATITVTPHFTYDGLTCDGPPETFTITVNPTAQVDDPADQVVCNTDLTTVTYTTTTSGGTPTYTWVNDTPGIGLPASGSGDISFNAVNNGTAPVVATIVVTPHFTFDGHTCDGPTEEFTITVNPTAQVDDPGDQVLCNTEITTDVVFTTDRTLGVTTYTWTNDAPSIGLAASGSGDIPAFAAINTGSAPVIATIAVTPHFTYAGLTCDGPVIEFTITVNPTAQVVDPADLVVCNADNTGDIIFATSRTLGITTYTWTNDTPSIGLAASGSGDILSFPAVNLGTFPVVATITVTPHFTYDGHTCDGPPETFTITVNPTAQVDPEADQVVCNTENTVEVIFSTNRTLGITSYIWTNDTPSIGLAATGTGDVPVFTAVNTGSEPVIATITVTPHFDYDGLICDGPPETFTITVNPTAQVDIPADLVVCNTENTAEVIFTSNRTLGITTYTWTNDTPAIGLAASGSGNILSFAAINLGLAPVVATITVTPHFTYDAYTCDGPPETFTITVNPTAQVDDPVDQLLCQGETSDLVTFTTTTTGGNVTYTWTNDNPSIGLAASGSGDIPPFLATNTGVVAEVATITVTPHYENGGHTCDGPTQEFIISVNPRPAIEVDVADTICNEDDITFTITNPNVPIFGDWKYNLSVDYGTDITGLNIGGEYDDTDVFLTDHLVNSDTMYHSVSYHFTPRITPSDGGSDCLLGIIDTTILVWVNPTPAIRVLTEDSVLCNGEPAIIKIRNPNRFLAGDWEYNLAVNADPEISGARGDQNNMVDTLLVDPLINHDTIVHKVEYRFTPLKTPDPELICGGGNDTTIVIWVNPTPEVRVTMSDTMLCDNDNLSVQVRNPNVPIRGTWDGTMEVVVDPGITGITAGIYPYNGDITYPYTLNNSDPVARSITFIFHPQITGNDGGAPCNNGIDTIIVVWVNPVPDIGVTATDTLICNEEIAEFQVDIINTVVQGQWVYDLEVVPDLEITGARVDGIYTTDSTLIRDRLFNTDTAAHKVTYHFTPRIIPSGGGADCENGRDTLITIWVNPTPRVLVEFPDTIFCDMDTINIQVNDGLGFVYGDKEYILTAVFNTSDVRGITRNSNDPQTFLPGTPIADIFENLTQEAQPVFYIFSPRIVPSDGGPDCANGEDIIIRIWINPSPELDVDVPDDIICDTNIFEINVSTPNGDIKEGTVVYYLDVTYNPAFVSPGGITPDGERLANQSITDLLINNSDTVQVLTYRLSARIRDDRPGHGGQFCDNGTDTTILVLLNPTPRLNYTLMEDSLCYDDGFTILTDSAVYATHPLYFELDVVNDNNLTGVISPANYPVAGDLPQEDVLNPHLGYGRLEYNIRPYISSEGCLGSDTTFFIDVNPEPRMMAQLSTPADTAVCFDEGYTILMNTSVDSTTGPLVYELLTHGYNPPNVDNERPSGDYFIQNLDQESVLNNGEFIEDVTYRYIPVIRNVNGQGKNCFGTAFDSITVQVAPELRGVMTPDTTYVGDWEIRCFGLEDAMLHSNVRGGYYRDVYNFDWDTDGAFGDRLVDEDSLQYGLGVGTYWYGVVDVIGCAHGDTIILDQPEIIDVPFTVVDASCAQDGGSEDGSIDISPTGGTLGYDFGWTGPFGFMSDKEDVVDAGSGPYHLIMNDTNLCAFNTWIEIEAAEDIVISAAPKAYGNYEITCNGASTGELVVNSIIGGFPGYRLNLYDEILGDTIYRSVVPESGGSYSITVPGLEAGRYTLIAYDQTNCYSYNSGGYLTHTLDEPDTISIIRTIAPNYSDTVDVSCFGADDGFIDIELTGGHTADYANTFNWTGIPGDPDLVAGDSIQGSPGNGYLSGGIYSVDITDFWGCQQSAQFTLIEPTRMLLDVDSVRTLNGWNITCFGDNDGFIEISSSGGIMDHTYVWGAGTMILPDPNQQDLYNLVADTFHLTITDDIGCTFDTVFEILQPNVLELIETIPRINEWEIACAGDSTGEITLTPMGGADSLNNTYLWSTTDGYISDPASMNQTNLPEGNYEVLVTDINLCTYQISYELLDPDPVLIESLMSDSAYCAGTASGSILMEASGGVDPFVYLWNGPDGYSASTEDIADLFAGVYTITITDDNLCVKDSLIEVFEADHFDVLLTVDSDYHGANISCDGYSDGMLSVAPQGGTGPYFYAWNTGGTTSQVTGLPAGYYSVIVNDTHGCTDSANVTIDDPAPLDFTMYPEDPACYGDSTGRIEFLVTGGTVYTVDDYRVWVNDLVNGTVVENLPSGVYQIRVEDLNDCMAETEAELFDNDALELSFDTEDAFCPDKKDGQMSLYVDGGIYPYDISWTGELPDNEQSFNELRSGEYVVTVIDAEYCVTIGSVVVGYTFESCLIIPNAFSPNGDGINDQWVIEGLELYPDSEIRIFDRWGSRVYYSPTPVSDPWNGTFDGRKLPIDSYYYIIDLGNGDPPIPGNITIVR